MIIHLIRHAHAGHRSDWDGDDELRPLDKRGRKEAEAIAEQLAGAGIDVLWSSRYVRCRQTLEPLGERLGLQVKDHDAFAEGGYGTDALEALLEAAAKGKVVAACSHGDVVPSVIAAAVRRGAVLDGPPSPAKADRYELDVTDGKIARITHVSRPKV